MIKIGEKTGIRICNRKELIAGQTTCILVYIIYIMRHHICLIPLNFNMFNRLKNVEHQQFLYDFIPSSNGYYNEYFIRLRIF